MGLVNCIRLESCKPLSVLTTLVLISALQLASIKSAYGCAQMSASVRLLADIDWKFNCFLALQNLRNVGATSVNFVITQYWVDEGGDMVPDYFCFRLGNHPCVPVTQERIDAFTQSLTTCFQAANNFGFKLIEITPHLDDGNITARWRNMLQLNPEQSYGGWTYKDFHITPILNAMKYTQNQAAIYMSMQGEMNTAIMMFPNNWLNLAYYIKGYIPGIKVGINNNFNELCKGCNFQPDGGALNNLYNTIDYIGISAYAPVPANIQANDIAESAVNYARGMGQMGVDVKQLLGNGKEFHYSEFGVGGGAQCNAGPYQIGPDCVATSADQVASFPFYGLGSNYRTQNDPWQNYDAKNYLKNFYQAALQFAGNNGAQGFYVTQIFIWGYGSYDILGIHPMSTTRFGTWRQQDIVDMVTGYNNQCQQ